MSSMPPAEVEVIRPELARLLNREVTSVDRIGGGFNSQVYRVTTAAEPVVLKIYFRHANDRRDRLATDYGSFEFLWANGVREIPRPILSDPGRGWAVYEFVEGEKIPRGQAGEKEVA